MENKQFGVDPLHGNIVKGMVLFALPIMGTAFLEVLFSSVDTMVIGRYGSENAMACVGAGASVINLLVSAITALGTGFSIAVGMRCGEGDKEGIQKILQGIPLTGFAIGSIVTLIAELFCEQILRMVQCPETLLQGASLYFRIYFLAVPFLAAFTFLAAVLQARGQSTPPFLIQVFCGALNLGLNLLFVILFGWDVAGVAIATVLSQAVSVIAILIYFIRIEREYPLEMKKLTLFIGLGQAFRLGIPASLESVTMNISGVVIQAAINGFSETVISGNTVSASIEGLICVSLVGFSNASVVFISQNFGNKDLKRVRKIQLTATAMALLSGEVLGTLIYLVSDPLIGLYTDVFEIAQIAKLRLLFMCLPYGLCATMNVMSGCVQGLGKTKISLGISIFTSCFLRILWVCTYARWQGTISAIYLSYPLCWAVTTFLYLIAFFMILRENAK